MNRQTKLMLALILATAMTNAALAECQGSENLAIPAATPSEAFFDFADGTVLHRPTRLIWMRCAIGQDWTGSRCSGEPELMNWAAALNAAADAELNGHSDWRLPNRNELNSIVETRCDGPSLNGDIFPDSPIGPFWTSSAAQADSDQVWTLEFDKGALLTAPVSANGALRLVRAGRM